MGEKRQPRSTQKLTAEELTKMARASTGEQREVLESVVAEDDWQDVEIALGSQANVAPISARTTTVSDPMTMALLAEVARNSRTVDFDDERIEEARALAGEHDEITKPEVVHPHIKRRG
jgi:hypothetical protein